MTVELVLPGTPAFADAARALPRQYREPVRIPEGAPQRADVAASGGAGDNIWPWIFDHENGWPTRAAGDWPVVNERTVTGIPAAWRCLSFIANAGASCAPPIEFDSDGARVDVLASVVERPWALLGAHEFWAQAIATVLLYGNFVGINIDRDPATGYPRQIMPVHPDDVRLVLLDGLPVYAWGGEVFAWDEITHVRGYTAPGSLWGMGVIQAFRLSLGVMTDTAAFGAATFRSAAENSVVIQVDRPELTPVQADAIQDAWITRHGSGVRRPAVIPRSMTITPLSFSPADAQFLESRQLGIAEIAFMFGMDPTDLDATVGSGGSITYANREQREIERITHSVGPWTRRFEQAWADVLPGRRTMLFNFERLLRTDTLTRLQASDVALRTGVFTLDDARAVERLPLYGTEWSRVPFGRPPAPEPASAGPAPADSDATAEAL